MSERDRRRADRRQKPARVSDERRQNDRRSLDRRSASRVPLELWMEEMSGNDVYYRRTGNVSEGGVYFDRAIPHALGTIVTLKFALPGDGEMVVARGKVVSAADGEGLGMGVKFLSVEGDGIARIQKHIRAG